MKKVKILLVFIISLFLFVNKIYAIDVGTGQFNKSLLERKDISSFELESGSQVYYNIPPLDEKRDNAEHLSPLLEKLNIINGTSNNSSNDKFMGIFRY